MADVHEADLKYGSLQIDEDLRWQAIQWRVQRVCWGLFLGLIIAALCGVFGYGFLSTTSGSSSDGAFEVRYERFARASAPTVIQVVSDSGGEKLRVYLTAEYLESVVVEHISPEPADVELEAGRQVFVFKLAPDTGRGVITFSVQPHVVGTLVAEMGTPGGASVQFEQWVYP